MTDEQARGRSRVASSILGGALTFAIELAIVMALGAIAFAISVAVISVA